MESGRLLRPAQVAEALAVSRGQIYRLIDLGQIRAIRIAGSVRIQATELQRLLDFGTEQMRKTAE